MARNTRLRRRDDKETLERLKRWPSLMSRFPKVRIYSEEWGYFWQGTGQGYTGDSAKSAVLDIKEAYRMTAGCCEEKRITFIPAQGQPQ